MTFSSFSCPYRPCHNIEQIFSRCRIVLWPKASSRIRGLPVFLRPDGLRRLPWKSRPTGWYILTPVPYPCPGRRTLAPSSPYSSRQPAFFPCGFPSSTAGYHRARRVSLVPGTALSHQKVSACDPDSPCHPQATLIPPQIPYTKNLDSR